jgi:hypothetical protein
MTAAAAPNHQIGRGRYRRNTTRAHVVPAAVAPYFVRVLMSKKHASVEASRPDALRGRELSGPMRGLFPEPHGGPAGRRPVGLYAGIAIVNAILINSSQRRRQCE